MSELPHGIPETETLAKVIELKPKTDTDSINPELLSDDELARVMLDMFCHPSRSHMDSATYAESLRHLIDPELMDKDVQSLSQTELTWRQSLLKLSVDSSDLSDEQYDEFLKQDPLYGEIVRRLQDTRAQSKDLTMQRRALLALQDFRLGVTTRDIETRDEDWRTVMQRLVGSTQHQP